MRVRRFYDILTSSGESTSAAIHDLLHYSSFRFGAAAGNLRRRQRRCEHVGVIGYVIAKNALRAQDSAIKFE
jgi:hypothetical protein